MNKSNPLISIITVSFNAVSTIQKTIESVVAQTYPNIEYIVVDGASTDCTVELITGFSTEIDVVISEPDTGIYNAMNKGARLSKGDYMLFLNADDYLFSADSISLVVKRMCELGRADIYYGDVLNLDPETGKASVWQPRQVSAENLYRSTIPHPSSVISKTVFNELKGYDESMKISADHDFFVRAFVRQKSFKYLDTLVSVFRLGGVSTTGKFNQLLNEERERSIRENFSTLQRGWLKARVRVRKIFGV